MHFMVKFVLFCFNFQIYIFQSSVSFVGVLYHFLNVLEVMRCQCFLSCVLLVLMVALFVTHVLVSSQAYLLLPTVTVVCAIVFVVGFSYLICFLWTAVVADCIVPGF